MLHSRVRTKAVETVYCMYVAVCNMIALSAHLGLPSLLICADFKLENPI